MKNKKNYDNYPNILKEPMKSIKKYDSISEHKLYYGDQVSKKLQALYGFYDLNSLDPKDSLSLVVELANEFIPGFSFKSDKVGAPNIWDDESFSLDFYMRVKSKQWEIENKINSKCSIANAIKYIKKDLGIEISERRLQNIYSDIKKLRHIVMFEKIIFSMMEKYPASKKDNPYKIYENTHVDQYNDVYKGLKSRKS